MNRLDCISFLTATPYLFLRCSKKQTCIFSLYLKVVTLSLLSSHAIYRFICASFCNTYTSLLWTSTNKGNSWALGKHFIKIYIQSNVMITLLKHNWRYFTCIIAYLLQTLWNVRYPRDAGRHVIHNSQKSNSLTEHSNTSLTKSLPAVKNPSQPLWSWSHINVMVTAVATKEPCFHDENTIKHSMTLF